MKLIKKIQNLAMLSLLLLGGFNCAAEDGVTTANIKNNSLNNTQANNKILEKPTSPSACVGPVILDDNTLRSCEYDNDCILVPNGTCKSYIISKKYKALWDSNSNVATVETICPCLTVYLPPIEAVKCINHQCTGQYKPLPVIQLNIP